MNPPAKNPGRIVVDIDPKTKTALKDKLKREGRTMTWRVEQRAREEIGARSAT